MVEPRILSLLWVVLRLIQRTGMQVRAIYYSVIDKACQMNLAVKRTGIRYSSFLPEIGLHSKTERTGLIGVA